MVNLWWVSLSVTSAARVVSLPVPAVVGTATVKGRRCSTFSTPFMRFTGTLGRTMRAPTTFAQSMAEPPPKPMMA